MNEHPCFTPPPNPDLPIWRYVDLETLSALLLKRRLFLCRSDLLGDLSEGSVSVGTLRERERIRSELFADLPPAATDRMFAETPMLLRRLRQWTFISCWHMNEHESAAMWSLYGRAAAIRSTYRRLRRQFSSPYVYIGMVRYIDYATDTVPQGNSFWPYVFKRKSFEHEQELRVVVQDKYCDVLSAELGLNQNEVGRELAIDTDDLIEAVVIAPDVPEWKRDVIESIIRLYGFGGTIRQSALNAPALY